MKQLPVIPAPDPDRGAAAAGAPPDALPRTGDMVRDAAMAATLEPRVLDALRQVFDPEIPVNICDLGLIYEVIVDASAAVGIRMTLTAPACPAAQILPAQVRDRVAAVDGVTDVRVDIVWDPPWDRDRMSDAAKLQLGMF